MRAGLLALCLLTACVGPASVYGNTTLGGAPHPGELDEDHDGSYTPEDCNDHDAHIYPGAPDPEGDGIDQNCDGVDGVADKSVIPLDSQTGSGSGSAP